MSISRAVYVSCDNCGDPGPVVVDGGRRARAAAHQVGYRRSRVDGEMVDLCPACVGTNSLTGEKAREWDYRLGRDPSALRD